MKTSSTALSKAIDKMLNYSLPLNVTNLKIELGVNCPPLITVQYIPNVSNTLETDISACGVTEQFNVVPIKKKKKNVNNHSR